MIPSERRAEIMRILTARRRETMGRLADELHVTSRTIRSDVIALMVDYPLETQRGNGGCVKVADWYHPHRNIPCRFSYLHCWEPDSVNGGDPKYSVSAIIPKGDTKTIEKIRAAVENAKKESLSKWGGKIPPNLKLPLRDGDIERPDDEAYAGCYFLNANSRQAPQVVDRKVQPILDQSEVYSGCYGQISVTFYGFNTNGNRGIAAGLGNIQKLRDGEPLGGKANAAEEFETYDDDDFLS